MFIDRGCLAMGKLTLATLVDNGSFPIDAKERNRHTYLFLKISTAKASLARTSCKFDPGKKRKTEYRNAIIAHLLRLRNTILT